jgi:acetyltransferase
MTAQPFPASSPAARRPGRGSLNVFVAPATVAVFGATETPGSVGRAVMSNLIGNPFGGILFPVSPMHWSVLGVKAYRSLAAVPEPIDLAVVATPPGEVPTVLAECAAACVRGAIILSADFREGGPEGAELARQIREHVGPGRMRALGPNSIGVACPRTGINATFAPGKVRPGCIGFVSQSRALLSALAGGPEAGPGCSAFFSIGAMADVDWADCLAYLGEDPQTRSIGLYVDSLGDPESFFDAVREVTLRKPVVVLKARRAARGGDDVPDKAFARAGALRVQTLADLFLVTELLTTVPVPGGRRLTVLSNAAVPALLAADAVLADGCELAPLSPATLMALDRLLPPRWGRQNPVDVGDDADSERYARAVEMAARAPESDAVLAILVPPIDPVQVAEQFGRVAAEVRKPLLAVCLWGASSPEALTTLERAGVPTFSCPDSAVRTFGYLWRYGANLRALATDRETTGMGRG